MVHEEQKGWLPNRKMAQVKNFDSRVVTTSAPVALLCRVSQMVLTKHRTNCFGVVGEKHPTGPVPCKKVQGQEQGGEGWSDGSCFDLFLQWMFEQK